MVQLIVSLVQDLEKTCQVMTHRPKGENPVGFIPGDYESVIKTLNAFRELLVKRRNTRNRQTTTH